MGWVEDKTGIDVTPIDVNELDDVADAITDAFDGIGDFVGQIGESVIDAAASPIGQIAISIAFPQYAAYINAATKVANGEDLTAYDFVSLGIQGYSDLNAGVKVDPKIVKASKAAARIADGADPAQVLIGSYGADFVNELNLDTTIENAVGDVLGEDAWQFVAENMDINQAAADLIAGENPLRMLSNQFGDEVVGYMSSGDPQLEALGYGGLTTVIGLDEGLDPEKALLRGAKEYYDRGGEVPDINDLKQFLPDMGSDITWETPEWFKNLSMEIPDIDFSGFNWKNFGMDLPEITMNFPDLNLGSLNWEGIDYDVFQDYSLPELQDMGIDLEGLRLPEITLALKQQQMQASDGGGQLPEDDEEDLMARTTDNPLLDQEDQLPLSRALLQRTGTLG